MSWFKSTYCTRTRVPQEARWGMRMPPCVKLRPQAKMPVMQFGGDQGQLLTFFWILTGSAPEFSNSVEKIQPKVRIWNQFATDFSTQSKNMQIGPSWKGHKGAFRDPAGILKGPLKESITGASLARRKSLSKPQFYWKLSRNVGNLFGNWLWRPQPDNFITKL